MAVCPPCQAPPSPKGLTEPSHTALCWRQRGCQSNPAPPPWGCFKRRLRFLACNWPKCLAARLLWTRACDPFEVCGRVLAQRSVLPPHLLLAGLADSAAGVL